MSTLLLIDGHSQAYRAYFGVKTPLATSFGELTTAVFGFARKLLSILREYQPDAVAVAFDLGDTWRHAEFADYKGTRESMPGDLQSQMGRIEEMLRAFNIPILTYEGYEADDILGTLANRAAEQGDNVLILTGDRDLFQLASDRIKILYTSGGPRPQTSVYGPAEVYERYELTPQEFLEMKALTGDSSDNIPGVPGVGEKTAIKFLKEYGSIANLYAHIDEISGTKTRQSLLDAQEQVLRNQRLVTIVTDLDVAYEPDRFRLDGYHLTDIVRFFNELEMRSLVNEVQEMLAGVADNDDTGQLALFGEPARQTVDTPAQGSVPQTHFVCVQDEATLDQLVAALGQATRISFDVETDSTDAIVARLVGLGIAWTLSHEEDGTPVDGAAYVPVAHSAGPQLPWETVRAALQPFFTNAALPKLAHNGKYDLTVCRQHGLEASGPLHDTMTIAWLLDPASRNLGLKALAAIELERKMTEITDLIGSGRKQITIDQVDIGQVAAYCAADVDVTLHLYDKLVPRLHEAGMWSLYEEIELPLLPVLTDMELAGIMLDTGFLAQMSQELNKRLLELETRLFEIVGHKFNLRSTQQLSQVLFDEMGFPTQGISKTSSGNYSTAVGELEKLAAKSKELSAEQAAVIEIIFEQRQLEKLRGTYVDTLPTLVNPKTGRVHTSYNQTGAVTGRVSSSNPNLQNIPIRTEVGRQIRRAFVAPPGWLLLAADYSQVELRILAHIAQEEVLRTAFNADQDIHDVTAAKLFNIPIESVSRDQRGLAKTINYATIYGVSAFGISSRTEMDTVEARRFLDQYFATYPKIQEYIDATLRMAHSVGYVQTLLGRKRFFPELNAGRLPVNQRMAVERAAMNAPIQGTAADIMKIAMVRLHKRLQEGGYRARMLLQVHDELVLELPPEEQADVVRLVRETMESAYQLSVPLRVDIEVGQNWYEMEEA